MRRPTLRSVPLALARALPSVGPGCGFRLGVQGGPEPGAVPPEQPFRDRSVFEVDAVSFARSLVQMGLADRSAIRAAVAEAQGQRALWVARLPLIQQLLADLKRQLSGSTAHTQRRRPQASSKAKKPMQRRIARHR
jgi:hypothetical protein